MRNFLYLFVPIILCVVSCKHQTREIEYNSYDEMVEVFDQLVTDSESTWEDIITFARVFTDTLSIRAAEKKRLEKSLLAQYCGYMLISLITDKYDELKERGKNVNYDDIPPLLDRIGDLENVWFSALDEQVPHIWKDHFYLCHQTSERPIAGYFHVMATLPCETLPSPTLQIFYPDAAEDAPVLIFSKYLDNGSEDTNNREIIPLLDWSIEEDFPMHAEAGADIIEKMLEYDVMYMAFRSCASPYGDPAEQEIARLSLASLHDKWKEALGSKTQ